MDINLTNILKNIGFDEKEAKVYLALLELGRGTATEVSKQSQLKRAIVYHVIERLKKRGYAQEVQEGKIKHFSASDPGRVLQNVSAATESLKIVMPVIKALQDKGRERPRIEFFEDKEAILSIYRHYSSAKNVRYLSSMKRLVEIIPNEVVSWSERLRSGRAKSTEKHLLNDSKEDHEWAKLVIKSGQQARILPKNNKFYMDFTIADDVLGITSFDPLFIVVIHSAGIASSAAQLFDLAWLQGQDL